MYIWTTDKVIIVNVKFFMVASNTQLLQPEGAIKEILEPILLVFVVRSNLVPLVIVASASVTSVELFYVGISKNSWLKVAPAK